jgi:NitT/TauT family transport system ATP-binding protein
VDQPVVARPELELDGVSVRYGDVLAVADATLAIGRGEFIAVVGPSGCGKSSLLKLASGLLAPSGGRVRLAGAGLTGPVKGVGMAFQNATLLPWRTTIENVMLPLEIVEPFKSSRDQAGLRDRALRMLATVGLEEFADKYPWQLSGGMQQRASLCRAIVHEPSLVMLDEPFAALDAFTREELWAVMQDLWLKQRFTAILVTHDLREAGFLADTIYIMSSRPGRVLHRYAVEMPRPRTVETTFEPGFVDLVHALRQRIAELRSK